MPISREEFEFRRLNLLLPIRQILEANEHLAFNATEIQQRLVNTFGRRSTTSEVAQALNSLVSAGVVEYAEFAGDQWYTIATSSEDS